MDRHYAVAEIDGHNRKHSSTRVFVHRSKSPKSQRVKSNELIVKLQAMDRQKNQFIATLAHELRNPLAPIKCALDSMGMMELNEEVECLRCMMTRQVGQLAFLINDLLDISRISCGKLAFNREIVDLHSIISTAVEVSSTFINESGQTLTVSDLDENDLVFADASRLTQVVCNLLNNASKYGGPDCRIELDVQVLNQMVTIRVRDNGIGIAADQLSGIFELFAQVNRPVDGGSTGLGIGLSLAKSIVELHGGTVTAESDGIGYGSVFVVRLPIATQPPNLPAMERETIREAGSRAFRVLVIEDHRALRLVMVKLLEKMGHTVEVAQSAEHALEKLESFTPEIIFSDISMPGMDGYQLARTLRHRKDMALFYMVAMTGSGTASDRDLAVESGFDELMTKPVEIQRLQTLFKERTHAEASRYAELQSSGLGF
jgi:CheY-like chemotaxis protein/nitrogen-specific signal transduction histidine kinase